MLIILSPSSKLYTIQLAIGVRNDVYLLGFNARLSFRTVSNERLPIPPNRPIDLAQLNKRLAHELHITYSQAT